MDRAALSSALDGGYVTAYALDLVAKAFTMKVEVLDAGKLSMYDVSFDHISLFEFRDEKVNQWERLELTEIRVEEIPEESSTEEWLIWLNFWDAAEVTLRCAAVRVDGKALT